MKETMLVIPSTGIGDHLFVRPVLYVLKARRPKSEDVIILGSTDTKHLIEPQLYTKIWESHLRQKMGKKFHTQWALPIKAAVVTYYLYQNRISTVVNLSNRNLSQVKYVAPFLEVINGQGTSQRNDIHISQELLQIINTACGDNQNLNLPKPRFRFQPEELSQLEVLKRQIEADRSAIFLMDTAQHIKDWPYQSWVQLGRSVSSMGLKVFISCLSNPSAEKSAVEEIPNAYSLPKLPLHMAISLLSEFALAVSLDSGIGHWLSAMETPNIMLYGPTLTSRFGPLGDNTVVITGERRQDCRFRDGWCMNFSLNRRRYRGGLLNPTTCMASISPDEVAERILDGISKYARIA